MSALAHLYFCGQSEEGYPNVKEAVLKTAGRKPLQVRILSPPPLRSNRLPKPLSRRGLLRGLPFDINHLHLPNSSESPLKLCRVPYHYN